MRTSYVRRLRIPIRMTNTESVSLGIETAYAPTVVVMADHSSPENSRVVLEAAAAELTGAPPIRLDARDFLLGGGGRVDVRDGGRLTLTDRHGVDVTPDALVVYEIAPNDRQRFEQFQAVLRRSTVSCLGAGNAQAWRDATDKERTVARFVADNVRHAETIALHRPSRSAAVAAFDQLGRNVWARPTKGTGGQDVFHVDNPAKLLDALDFYAAIDQDWLVSRDAGNWNEDGLRHQFRVIVLGERVVRVSEHIQDDPEMPCNRVRGARTLTRPVESLPAEFHALAVAATRSLGLHLGGVDLSIENGGMVFEVNVHPVLGMRTGLESVAIPFVAEHLAAAATTRVP
jgi:glutathione synthase/RimK-type ligase-like ATP-grasp enzyme